MPFASVVVVVVVVVGILAGREEPLKGRWPRFPAGAYCSHANEECAQDSAPHAQAGGPGPARCATQRSWADASSETSTTGSRTKPGAGAGRRPPRSVVVILFLALLLEPLDGDGGGKGDVVSWKMDSTNSSVVSGRGGGVCGRGAYSVISSRDDGRERAEAEPAVLPRLLLLAGAMEGAGGASQ